VGDLGGLSLKFAGFALKLFCESREAEAVTLVDDT